jgi:hypothetical protein
VTNLSSLRHMTCKPCIVYRQVNSRYHLVRITLNNRPCNDTQIQIREQAKDACQRDHKSLEFTRKGCMFPLFVCQKVCETGRSQRIVNPFIRVIRLFEQPYCLLHAEVSRTLLDSSERRSYSSPVLQRKAALVSSPRILPCV